MLWQSLGINLASVNRSAQSGWEFDEMAAT